jgi:hypothetical protein
MATNGNTQATPPAQPAKCAYCGKVLTRAASTAAGIGHKCAQLQAQFTPAQLQAHYATLTGNVPAGYVTVASFKVTIPANAHKVPGLTISKLVRAIGGDRATGTLANPICKPVYNGRQRWVNGWLATPPGLQAIATGNYSKAPKP